MPKKIIVAGGGTGGHFFPAVALAEELVKRGYELHLVTDDRCAKYLSDNLDLTGHILNFGLRRENLIGKLRFALANLILIIKSVLLLRKLKPSILVGFGGYATFPPLLASILLRIPIIIHEQNCFLGRANKFFLKFAKKVSLSYLDTKNVDVCYSSKVIFSGEVIRQHIRNLTREIDFNDDLFKIFIFGGSQGAAIFSALIPQSLKILKNLQPSLRLHITQQARQQDAQLIINVYEEIGVSYQLAEFFPNISEYYSNHHLVISRSGASTIAELSAVGLPAILIPYPFAMDNHQLYNAMSIQRSQAGWCIEQNSLTVDSLARQLLEIINNRSLLQQAANNLLKRKNDGSKILADTVEKIIS